LFNKYNINYSRIFLAESKKRFCRIPVIKRNQKFQLIRRSSYRILRRIGKH